MLSQERALKSIEYLEGNVRSVAERDPSTATQPARWGDGIEEEQVDKDTRHVSGSHGMGHGGYVSR